MIAPLHPPKTSPGFATAEGRELRLEARPSARFNSPTKTTNCINFSQPDNESEMTCLLRPLRCLFSMSQRVCNPFTAVLHRLAGDSGDDPIPAHFKTSRQGSWAPDPGPPPALGQLLRVAIHDASHPSEPPEKNQTAGTGLSEIPAPPGRVIPSKSWVYQAVWWVALFRTGWGSRNACRRLMSGFSMRW